MPKQTTVERLESLALLLEPTRRKLYEYVAHRATAVSRDQAASALGISRAMAAFHLDRLVAAGLLRAQYRHISRQPGLGAGRPSKLYRRSRRRFDVLVPKRDHELLARFLAEAVAPPDDSSPTLETAHRYGRSLGMRARRRMASRATAARLVRCVEDVLREVGYEPVADDPHMLWARNCPFEPLSRQLPDVVCRTSIAMVNGVLEGVGTSALRVSRDYRPGRCCLVVDAQPEQGGSVETDRPVASA